MRTSPKAVEAIAHIVLAKLASDPKKKAAQAKLSKDLAGLAPGSGSSWKDLLQTALERLQEEKLIERDKRNTSTVTPEGETRALKFLRADAFPGAKVWDTVRNGHLMAVALGLPAPTPDQLKTLISAPGFKASLLRSKFHLKIAEYPTAAQAADALAWKLIGVDSDTKFSRDACIAALAFRPRTHVAGLFEGEANIAAVDPKKAVERVVTKSVGARNANAAELRNAAIRSWIESLAAWQDESETKVEPVVKLPDDRDPVSPPEPPPPPPFDLPTFANLALEAALQAPPEGWFGDNKVFIAHAWQASRDNPVLGGMDLSEFKKRLTEANQARLLTLSRADLVEAMNPTDVRASEIHHLGASYHFILVA